MKQLTLSYTLNGDDLGIAYKNITNTQYKAAVDTYFPSTSIELIGYEC